MRQRIKTDETQTQKDFRYYFNILPNQTEYLKALADLEASHQPTTYDNLKVAMTERNRFNQNLYNRSLLTLIRNHIITASTKRLQPTITTFAITDPFARTLLQLPHAA